MTSSIRQLLSICLVFFTIDTYAQETEKNQKTNEDYKTFAYGITTNTNSGLIGGFVIRHSSTVGSFKNRHALNRYIALEAINIKNIKEKTEPSAISGRFIYGKTNYFFSLRPQYGREIMYFKRSSEEGIGLSVIIAGGPSIGIQKPYYIKYSSGPKGEISLVQYNPSIHTIPSNIQGSVGIWQNFFQGIQFNPGLHLKLAANIDMNTFGNGLTGFEIGMTGEYFSKTPEIMSSQLTHNAQLYTSGFITLYFGNRTQKTPTKKSNLIPLYQI